MLPEVGDQTESTTNAIDDRRVGVATSNMIVPSKRDATSVWTTESV